MTETITVENCTVERTTTPQERLRVYVNDARIEPGEHEITLYVNGTRSFTTTITEEPTGARFTIPKPIWNHSGFPLDAGDRITIEVTQ